jgi:hypothetical protein
MTQIVWREFGAKQTGSRTLPKCRDSGDRFHPTVTKLPALRSSGCPSERSAAVRIAGRAAKGGLRLRPKQHERARLKLVHYFANISVNMK